MRRVLIHGNGLPYTITSFEVPRTAYAVLDVPSILESAIRDGLAYGTVETHNPARVARPDSDYVLPHDHRAARRRVA